MKSSWPWGLAVNIKKRHIDTVVLDDETKSGLLEDINRYLMPNTAKEHGERGIPYRRGYLFHGPPGTGKTSLVIAFASFFGHDIYAINLGASSLTEEGLVTLFERLPEHCIVLFEDINTSCVVKDTVRSPGSTTRKRRNKDLGAEDSGSSISLSALLNVLDGVGAAEGRVLIITANEIGTLPDALTRPGRIDVKTYFGLMTKEQAKEKFIQMYKPINLTDSQTEMATVASPSTSHARRIWNILLGAGKLLGMQCYPDLTNSQTERGAPILATATATAATTLSVTTAPAPKSKNHDQYNGSTEPKIPTEELRHMADEFAAQIPNNQYSMAKIHGYLVERLGKPRRAVDEIADWIKEEEEENQEKEEEKENQEASGLPQA